MRVRILPRVIPLALLLFLLPFILDRHNIQLATESVILAISAMAFIFLFGFAGLTSLATMAFYTTSGYFVGVLVMRHGYGYWTAAGIGIIAAIALAALFALITYRTVAVYFLMMTLALGQLVYGAALQWNSVTNGYNGIAGLPRPNVLGFNTSDLVTRFWFSSVILVLVYAMLLALSRSTFGLILRATRDHPEKASALGVNVRRQRLAAQLVVGLVAGIAGILGLLHFGVVSPSSIGLNEILKVIMASVVGGSLWLEGGLIGSAIVIYLISIVSGYTERYWLVVGAVFAVVVIFMPDGIIGWTRSHLGRLVKRIGSPPFRHLQRTATQREQ